MNRRYRKTIIAGNWKMNKSRAEAKALVEELRPLVENAGCGVVVCTPYLDIETAVKAAEGSNIKVGAQNCHWADHGAFTGEIPAEMLREAGAEYVIIGHSERRQYFGETDETVNKRTRAALDAGLRVILCCGELLGERQQNIMEEVVGRQIKVALLGVSKEEMKNIIIAYEPVWAIGTGVTATADQAEEACAFIRGLIAKLYGEETAEATTVQYGGSMNAKNAGELLSKEDVDGGLIGGASLKAPDFAAIVAAAGK